MTYVRRLPSCSSHERDGIFLARGPRLRRGVCVEGPRNLDVAPTVLASFGEPVPETYEVRNAWDAIEPSFRWRRRAANALGAHPIRAPIDVASRPALAHPAASPADVRATEEKMRELGYAR